MRRPIFLDTLLPDTLLLRLALVALFSTSCLQKDASPSGSGADAGPGSTGGSATSTGGGKPAPDGSGGVSGGSVSGGHAAAAPSGTGGRPDGSAQLGSGGLTGSGGTAPPEATGGRTGDGPASSGSGGNGTGGTATGGTATGGNGSGGAPPVPGPNEPARLTSGSSGWASRYWDCCKPACGWKANVRTGNPMNSCSQSDQVLSSADTKNACDGGGGGAFMCWSGAPWSVSDTLSYGFVAASAGNYVCGRCYQVQFTGAGHNGSNPGATSLVYKTMVVQVINNGGVAADQMDLLIPGGGVGALNACSTQWGNVDLGAQYGGFYAACKNDATCTAQMCQTAFAGKPELLAGCSWFLGWFSGADNPSFIFKQIACPSAITQKSGLSDPG
jgi:Glycosyl hydrolase family 45